jgi:hypothetical protein
MIDRIAERLKKLLLMLSSDHDGEVVSAARAIDRTLKDTGTDWHALVARLLAPAQSPYRAADTHHNYRNGNWRELREYCAQHSELLRSRELEFITRLADWRGNLTEKQHDWLMAIHARLRRQSQ